ncbi:hypothetical protein DBIPINDM_003546 [Mesorhizobium sp. AR02]|uniref:hypothetical protein n=1 Tax=Mesorhizobium sp. AR02 TaxID=2865837 RepID=UPI00216072D2|nr:hypothetical protein [Mesorhizobium sp. AR02]UVK50408.1 hypothetical protein DBIPINDM_003546 [Mesorhizobium sp. AR02]
MSARRLLQCEADCRAAVGINAPEISTFVAQWLLANAFRREFVLRRALAQISEAETADRGDEQAPTEGGPDKRPQCAARAVGCFCFCFSLIRQCAASARNVRLPIILLPRLLFSNISEAGDGRGE